MGPSSFENYFRHPPYNPEHKDNEAVISVEIRPRVLELVRLHLKVGDGLQREHEAWVALQTNSDQSKTSMLRHRVDITHAEVTQAHFQLHHAWMSDPEAQMGFFQHECLWSVVEDIKAVARRASK